ncbi:MAG: hypothetical protein J7L16_01285 [Deltaproteobacteria bacterium]|nr:hypothetical protein [Deltaproteobacteria bacterium]
MAALAGGIGALILGIIGIVLWWTDFLVLLKGGLPLMFIMGGALAAYLGFEEIKDKKSSESFETDESRKLKDEVETLKSELDNLKKNKDIDDKTED